MSEELSFEDLERLQSVAVILVTRGLAAPAVVLLEMYRPLTTLFHTGGVVMAPLLAPLFGYARCEEILRVLKDRKAIDTLISLIESENTKCKA